MQIGRSCAQWKRLNRQAMLFCMSNVTQILGQIENGDPSAAEQLLPLMYEELRKLAAAKLSHEKPGQTLQATVLVHEAYLRLVDVDTAQHWNSRGHFFAAAAEAMRRILVENARRKKSLKAGVRNGRIAIDDADVAVEAPPDDLLALNDALSKLADEDPVAADLAQLRLFGGLSVEEAAQQLGMLRRTGFRHWTYARAYLQLAMRTDGQKPEK